MALDLLPSVTDSVKRKNEEKDEVENEVETKRIKLNRTTVSVDNQVADSDKSSEVETKMETSEVEAKPEAEAPVTVEEIRRLKEILRQEDAKLQLIKKIKATFISDPKKGKQAPKIEAKIKNENGMISTNGKTLATTTVRIPKSSDTGISGSTIKSIGSAFTNGTTAGRSNSPLVTGDKATVQSTAASYEKNRNRKDLLKQQLNRTLKEITQAPPPPASDVNFFPSATNNEFLVLLGLEMCVNRLKRDDNTDTDFEGYCCAECGRDFSPSWKFDSQDRRLCHKCFNNIQMKELTQVQEGKFKKFKQFWDEKEQELKEIDYQLQRDEESMRQQRIEAEKERLRREQERVKKAELLRQKEKEAKKANAQLNNWAGQLNQKEIMAQLLRQHEMQKKQTNKQSNGGNMNSFGGNSTQNMAQQLAGALRNGSGNNSQVNETILRQLQQLASASSNSSNRANPLSNHLASIHTQMLKQELLRRQEKLRQDREEASRQAAMEQYRQQQAQLEARRKAQQQQQQSSQKAQGSTQQEQLLRNLMAVQQLMGGQNRGAGNGNSSGNNVLNQQLLQVLQSANPQALIQALQAQRGSGKN